MPRLTLALLALVLAFPAGASAQSGETNAPPGNSAIDEYVETVPGASGNRPPRRPDPAASTLPPDQRRALEQQGPEGEQLAELVDATAPPAAARTATTGGRAGRAAPPAGTPAAVAAEQAIVRADAHAASPVRSALSAAIGPNDAGGLGVLFPLILLASLVGMVALAMRRRRRSA